MGRRGMAGAADTKAVAERSRSGLASMRTQVSGKSKSSGSGRELSKDFLFNNLGLPPALAFDGDATENN